MVAGVNVKKRVLFDVDSGFLRTLIVNAIPPEVRGVRGVMGGGVSNNGGDGCGVHKRSRKQSHVPIHQPHPHNTITTHPSPLHPPHRLHPTHAPHAPAPHRLHPPPPPHPPQLPTPPPRS